MSTACGKLNICSFGMEYGHAIRTVVSQEKKCDLVLVSYRDLLGIK